MSNSRSNRARSSRSISRSKSNLLSRSRTRRAVRKLRKSRSKFRKVDGGGSRFKTTRRIFGKLRKLGTKFKRIGAASTKPTRQTIRNISISSPLATANTLNRMTNLTVTRTILPTSTSTSTPKKAEENAIPVARTAQVARRVLNKLRKKDEEAKTKTVGAKKKAVAARAATAQQPEAAKRRAAWERVKTAVVANVTQNIPQQPTELLSKRIVNTQKMIREKAKAVAVGIPTYKFKKGKVFRKNGRQLQPRNRRGMQKNAQESLALEIR